MPGLGTIIRRTDKDLPVGDVELAILVEQAREAKELPMRQDRRRRSIAKALTWRAGGTAFTAAGALVLTGSLEAALGIGAIDLFGKTALFYAHERLWLRFSFGRRRRA